MESAANLLKIPGYHWRVGSVSKLEMLVIFQLSKIKIGIYI